MCFTVILYSLYLTQLSEELDASFILQIVNSPGWLRYIGDRHIHSLQDARQYIANGPVASYDTHGYGLWLIKRTEDDAPIGICGLVKRDYLPHPDLGYALLPQFEGQGYAVEAAAAVVQHAMQVLSVPVIAAITTDDNVPSLRLLFKLGFDFIGMISPPQQDEELMLLEKR
jgi:RimJ/RimL family protein N-acetyltransferase